MTKIRLIITLVTILVVGSLGSVFGLYARGYRFNFETFKFAPNGILVIKSDPDGAQLFVDGELRTATNATIAIRPGTYDIAVKKEGYLPWEKRLTIVKEIVTEEEAHLFLSAGSLSPITFSGVVNPIASEDSTRLAFAVPPENNNGSSKAGLWIVETVNLPLGFSRDPRRISDGDLTKAIWEWSPDGREILVTTSAGSYLLESGDFTPQTSWINVASQKTLILADWEKESEKKLAAQLKSLPDELGDILQRKGSHIVFSPDETKVFYTAMGGESIPENLIKPIPGVSTQRQERDIKESQTYIYDIKEDRNFLISKSLEGKRLAWFATSKHLILAEDGRVVIMDLDGTNVQVIYSGSYTSPHAFPTLNENRIYVLTNLGATNSLANLYSLSIK